MTKVSLLGDSIRLIGYGTVVPSMLGENYAVFQPSDNCRFAKYTLRGLFEWRESLAGSEIIHWNNGLWDECELFGDGSFSSIEEYTENMLRIAKILKEITPKVIFATTTPASPQNQRHSNERIKTFNNAVVPLLQKEGILINDLFSLVLPHIDEYISEDLLHLSKSGIDVCARQVVDMIQAAKLKK